MKELSIEEKAKAYDKAVSEIRNLRDMLLKEGIINKDGVICNNFNRIFPELKESEDVRIRKEIIRIVDIWTNSAPVVNGIPREVLLAWLEKQGEQKPADKVESKFKVGDWIITNKNHIWYVDETPETTSYLYRLINQYGKVEVAEFEVVDNAARLWTIQDAKDGDILFQDLMGGKTFIYNGVNPDMAILYSFIISNDGEDVLPYHIGKPNTGIGNIEENKNIIHPATKDQRNLLFQKMREMGYEWNAKKKELRKIEKEIEIPFGDKDSELQEVTYYIPKGFHAEIDDDKVVIKKGEKTAEWSEEDERIYRSIMCSFAHNFKLTIQQQNFVKSLKDRYTWKPSDEQMKAFDAILVYNSPCSNECRDHLITLYNDLKKLR